jgi:DNA-binding PadR family transcriptional regulator
MLEYIILGFLLHGDMSGYDIKQFMTYSTANFYNASFGSIYPMLKKMEAGQTVCSKEIVDGGKYKKVYSIAPSGKELFFQWLNQPIVLNRGGQDHLVRMFFFGLLPTEKVRSLVTGFMEAVTQELASLESLGNKIGCKTDFFEGSTLDYGISYYRFLLQWCTEFMNRLNQQDCSEKGK